MAKLLLHFMTAKNNKEGVREQESERERERTRSAELQENN